MKMVAVVFQTEAWMSLRHFAIHQGPLAHGTGGSVGAFQAARLTPTSVNCLQHLDPRPCELGRLEYHWHRWGLVHKSDSGASKALVWSSQLEDSGACPPLEIRC
jgi:hypothetical protein